jgi:hypothetical protein
MSALLDVQADQNRKLVSGLLAGANSDLFHRYEAEESRTRALQERYDKQRQHLEDLTRRLSQVVGEVEVVEGECAQRITSIRQQLDRIDREESTVEARIRHKKRELLAMSAQLAMNRITMAFNFELESSAGQVQELEAGEVLDVLGHSTYTDEHGNVHRVEFTAAQDDASSTGGVSEPSSPSRSRDPAQLAADRNILLRKRAGYLLLDQARGQVLRDLKMVEEDFQSGRIHEFEHQALRGPLQLRLGEIRRAIEHIAGLAKEGTPAPQSVEAIFSVRPVIDPAFGDKLAKQRRALQDLKRTIDQEEALVGQRAQLGEQRWVEALAARDMEEFAQSRRDTAPQHSVSDVAAPNASSSSRAAPCTTSHESSTDEPKLGTHAPRPVKPSRPASASLLRRYSGAAKTVLAQAGERRGEVYERIVMNAALGEAPVQPSLGAGKAVYRFSSHKGLEAAAMSTMKSFTRPLYM